MHLQLYIIFTSNISAGWISTLSAVKEFLSTCSRAQMKRSDIAKTLRIVSIFISSIASAASKLKADLAR